LATARWVLEGHSGRVPETREQRCWWHKIADVLAALSKSAHPAAKKAQAEICNAANRAQAIHAAKAFEADYGARWPKAAAKIIDDLDVLLAVRRLPGRALDPPAHHQPDRVHLRHREAAHQGHRGTGSRAAASRWRSSSSSPPRPAGAP
jgi:hypothetical protein